MSQPAFASLDRVVKKYRSDVHYLPSGAANEAIAALEGHLRRGVPRGLRSFLTRHNGADLFRGALRIRSASDIAPASAEAPQVVLFADGQGEQHWAWADDGRGGHVFGPWDGSALEPLHSGFEGWLSATLNLLDTNVVRDTERDSIRFESDPRDAHQLLRAGVRALRQGDPDTAEAHLRAATTTDPQLAVAWQHLGDALAISDRTAARQAWLRAFRQTALPLSWPGAPCIEPDFLKPLRGAFDDASDWELELRRFLDDRVRDAASEPEVRLVVASAQALAQSLVDRGHRADAAQVLNDLLSRCRLFSHSHTPWRTLLGLAERHAELGQHDEAESLLRRLRQAGPSDLQGPGLLLLASMAITRQEPWAEEILDEAEDAGLDDTSKVQLAVLRVERAVRTQRTEAAQQHLAAAQAAVGRAGKPALYAQVHLVEGDVQRLTDQPDEAWSSYEAGLKRLRDNSDAELRHRLELRLGDLLVASGSAARADRHYLAATEGFAKAQLPIREGWALLRLARLRHDSRLLKAARSRFTEADLAAGVAATDSLAGNPTESLSWHLQRATHQARARHNAQRARPPWERADADRPERRLGAHRIAIAACGDSVVDALARTMADGTRALSTGRAHALDASVVHYVAAVDLLAGHRSWGAARVLLDHLLQRTVDGVAYRALQGAICRSPNAALVDGLLQCIERPADHPSHAVAAAAELLGMRSERAATTALLRLGTPGSSPVIRKAAIVALGRIGDRAAADVLLSALDEPPLAEVAALALLLQGDRRGVDFHGRALAEHRLDLSGHPGEIVGRYGGPEHLLLLSAAAEGTDDRALGALQGLGLLGDARGVPCLLQALSRGDLKVVEVAAGALEILTGHSDPTDQPGFRNRWHAWWESHADGYPNGVRHREGKMFDAGVLIDALEHTHAWTRRTAYDELVITTGCRLPFDAEGPWRVQRAHLRGWRRWWAAQRHSLPAGRWYLHGTPLA